MHETHSSHFSPWPTSRPPELHLMHAREPDEPVCVLLGCADTPRGRYGFFGVPSRVTPLSPRALEEGARETGMETLFVAPDGRPRVILLGYEMGAPLVHLPAATPPRGQPAGLVLDFSSYLVSDHTNRTFSAHGPAELSLRRALQRPVLPRRRASGGHRLLPTVSDAEHRERIHRAKAHIAAGDIYQANVTRRLALEGELDAAVLMERLAHINPVAHAAYLQVEGLQVLSASMETLTTYDAQRRFVQSFPIKGTERRHEGPPSLPTVSKERAEHVMIVDLVRNDLGRVCVPGTVHVSELMGIHGYRGLWHGVSTVEGVLRPELNLDHLVRALFPGGSITGAPKRRAMEIIAELEGEGRGVYTGSLAWLQGNGDLSMSILIRTLVRDAEGWSISVGGGIVADSDPHREVRETWDKMAVFAETLQDCQLGALRGELHG